MEERPFGPYRLVQQIAVGGMAEIHLAKAHGIAGFEKYVALKMIHPNFSQDQQFIQMLIDEAKITVQLQHVNIAQTFDLGRVTDTYYITMEYVDGADLYKLLRTTAENDREIPIAVAAYIAKEVANGLDYAHRKRDLAGQPLGIVHRDVSPQNVLISHAGEVKLVDFGIAKATSRAKQTAVGVIKGKYYYMSPEQAWGEPLDHRTDIFSTGILLYETLIGQMLYLEEDLHKLLDMVRKADIDLPTTLRPDIPPQLERIVMKALAKRPEDRYQDAGQMASEIERFLHSYAPVFTAAKVSGWIHDVLGDEGPVTLPGIDEGEAEGERDRHSETRRFTREQLISARSEFTDENSIIYSFAEAEAARSPGKSDKLESAFDDVETYDAPLIEDDDESDDGEDVTSAHSPVAAEDDPPTRQRIPTAPPLGRLPLPSLSAGQRARLPGAPLSSPGGRALPRLPPLSAKVQGGGGGAAGRNPEENTRLLADAAVAASSSVGDETAQSAVANSEPEEATVISEPPGFLSDGGEATDISAASRMASPPTHDDYGGDGGDATIVQGNAAPEIDGPTVNDDDELEAPTLMKAQPVSAKPPQWEPAPALSAQVDKPAVSALRPPRQSRKTPPGSTASESSPGALADLLRRDKHPPQVALAQPSAPLAPSAPNAPNPLSAPSAPSAPNAPTMMAGQGAAPAPGPTAPPSHVQPSPMQGVQAHFAPPGQGVMMPYAGQQPAPMTTRQFQASLELDEIPDKYKIRGGSLSPVWIAVGALLLAAVVAGVLIATLGGDDEGGTGLSATVEVVSSPPGAKVSIDQAELTQLTPTRFQGEAGKRYLISVDLPGHQRWEREHLVPEDGGSQTVVARLDPLGVKIIATSVPSEAEVFINGTSVGRTPLELDGLDPETTKSIEVRLKGYRPVRRALDWSRESEKELKFELVP